MMSGRAVQGSGGQPSIALRVKWLEDYCRSSQLTLKWLQEKIAGIPANAVGDSDFFHRACSNEGATLRIIECLLDAFPGAARSVDGDGVLPLHCACANKSMGPGIVRLLLDCWPESVNHRRSGTGHLPLHDLCKFGSVDRYGSVDDTALLAVLDLLLAAAPDSAAIVNSSGDLPIHLASGRDRPSSFCKRLIDTNPESLRVRGFDGCLPIHFACREGNAETVKYMLERNPESIDARDEDSDLPIHSAAHFSGEDKADIIRYLLATDPDCASKTGFEEVLPLHLAVFGACVDSVRLLFDAHPEAINIRDRAGKTPLDIALEEQEEYVASEQEVIEFLEAQLAYARLAEDRGAMTTPDGVGWLPLHHALRKGASLGAIKLLIAGNRDALQISDNQSAFPLHIACEFSSAEVVQHILRLSEVHLHALDLQKDSTLHYACRRGNVSAVKFLLERSVPSVSEPDSNGKLPVHLLWESDQVDRDSVAYVDAVWRLLLAHPETVTLLEERTMHQAAATNDSVSGEVKRQRLV